MQQVIRVYYDNPKWHERDTIERVNELLEEGWEVIFMQTFSGYSKTEDGSYGVTFVLDDSKKIKKTEEENIQQENIKEESVQEENVQQENTQERQEDVLENQISVENLEIRQEENVQNNNIGY